MNPYFIKYFVDKNITMYDSNGATDANPSAESPLYKTSMRHVFAELVFKCLDIFNPCVCIVAWLIFGSSIDS